MEQEKHIIKELVDTIEVAISAGDWKVDGACDPDYILKRAKKHLEEENYETYSRGGLDIFQDEVRKALKK